MVVQAMVQLAIAGPVGILFGLGYGTAIRVGYEIIFPSLFPEGDKNAKLSNVGKDLTTRGLPRGSDATLVAMEKMFTNIGGLEAHKFGVNQGIKNALKAIEADPELVELIKKNSNLGSQTITVDLSGISSPGGDQSQSSPSKTGKGKDISKGPSGASLKAKLAEAKRLKQLEAYTNLINQIGLSDDDIFTLVKNNVVTIQSAGYSIVIEYGLLTLSKQQEYAVIFNRINSQQTQTKKTKGARALALFDKDPLQSAEKYWFDQAIKYRTIPNPNNKNSPAWHSINLKNTQNSIKGKPAHNWIRTNSSNERFAAYQQLLRLGLL